MTAQRVIVVGAGIGGLVSALELAAQGADVLVLERAATLGGKLRQLKVAGVAMDAGPTVFTMRWVFDELFDAVGAQLSDHLKLQPLTVLARHAWREGEHLDLFTDRDRSADAIGLFAGAQAARGYLDFCARAASIYSTLETPFLRAARPNPITLVGRAGLRGLPGLMRIAPFTSLWSALGKHFVDPRLRQLFGRYATYCGSSPYQAPATLMLVAHVEQEGVWGVEGGMYRVAQTLAALAAERGARLRCNTPVERILTRAGRACGVRLAGGEELLADAVVFNGDVAALGAGPLGGGLLERADGQAVTPAAVPGRSLSAFTLNLLASTRGFALSRHTVFFSHDGGSEFADIFDRGRLPRAPTVYVCAQDRSGDAGDETAPAGAERLLMIVNAPACGDAANPITAEELARCEASTFQLLRRCGLRVLQNPDHMTMTTPRDFERLFPATGGSLYGKASHGWAASFSRPGARSRLPGLYLAGGSVHPGPGVPMAALSGRQAAASVLADSGPAHQSRSRLQHRLSTSTSPPAATPGGTSTR